MIAAIDALRKPSEHSDPAQKCDDEGVHHELIDLQSRCRPDIATGSFLLHTLNRKAGTFSRPQQRFMGHATQNTHESFGIISPPNLRGMNKHTYSACIEPLETHYVAMFLHLTTSTAIRAVDDLQSN